MKLRYKYRIYPSKDQMEYLERQFGCCRFVWNHLLSICSDSKDIKINSSLSNYITELKRLPSYSFLNDVSAVALQQRVLDLVSAFKDFFNRKSRHPKFKTKFGAQTFNLVGNEYVYGFTETSLKIAKCPGVIKMKMHRLMPMRPSSCTIIKTTDDCYYVSFVCESEQIIKNSDKSIGIDLGIKDFCITSDGVKYNNPRYFITGEHKLAKLQRQLSRKKKGSNNRNKARLKVASLHQHIVNQRNDFLHKLSTKLIRENQVICLEDLNASGMMRNRRLAKHIADVSWNRFCNYLTYKAVRYNRQLMVMNTFTPSTQTCSACHVQSETKLTLNVRNWVCNHCGAEHDRDVNAACVIHSVGMQYWQRNINNLATLMLVPRWKNGEFLI